MMPYIPYYEFLKTVYPGRSGKSKLKTERWIKGGKFRALDPMTGRVSAAPVNRRERRARGEQMPSRLAQLKPYIRTVPKADRKRGESRFIYV